MAQWMKVLADKPANLTLLTSVVGEPTLSSPLTFLSFGEGRRVTHTQKETSVSYTTDQCDSCTTHSGLGPSTSIISLAHGLTFSQLRLLYCDDSSFCQIDKDLVSTVCDWNKMCLN